MSPSSHKASDLEQRVHGALEVLQRHLSRWQAGAGAAIQLVPPDTLRQELELDAWIADGGMDPPAMKAFLDQYLGRVTALHHPGYAGHQVAVPHPASAVADLVNGFTNNGMAVYEMGPPAVTLELAVLRWMLAKVGWPAAASMGGEAGATGAGGVLTHGGSLANLTALLAARARCAPDAWQHGTPSDLVVFAPAASHYSVARAVSILGLGADAVWPIPSDERNVVQAEALPALAARATTEGKRVMAVVANAVSTATGCYDPLAAIGGFCRQHGYWFHVDGAHGASALLSPTHRERLHGIAMADSLVWDAHKMLQTSALCAAVLVRDDASLPAAFRQGVDYLVDHSHETGPDLIHRAIECTKAPLGLKLFLTLAAVGEDQMAAHWDRQCALALSFWERITARPAFESPCRPESNILCFRHRGDDPLQTRLRAAELADGAFYLTSAMVAGQRCLRMTVMNPATDVARVEQLLDRLEQRARSLGQGIC